MSKPMNYARNHHGPIHARKGKEGKGIRKGREILLGTSSLPRTESYARDTHAEGTKPHQVVAHRHDLTRPHTTALQLRHLQQRAI